MSCENCGECTCDCRCGNCEKHLRTPAEEAVLRAAVAWLRYPEDDDEGWSEEGWSDVVERLGEVTRALLRENPAWGEEGQR